MPVAIVRATHRRMFSTCGFLTCTILMGCAISIAAAEDVPPAAKSDAGWKSLFDGKTLTGWEITDFGTQGDVAATDGTIRLGFGDGCTGVTWKGEFPKTDYEVRLEAMRVDGADFFCGMTFPVGDDPCSLIVGGWGGSLVGLSSIDGKDAARNETKRTEKLVTGRWYKIRLRVSADKIQAWIDDKPVVDFVTTGRKLSIRPEVQLSRPFGICSWCTTAALRDIQVRPLPNAAK